MITDNHRMARTQIGARLEDDLVKAIDILATEQIRDRSNMIEYILTDWIKQHRPELLTQIGRLGAGLKP